VRDVYAAEGTIEHYVQRHAQHLDLALAERQLPQILADPDAVYMGGKPNTLIFVGGYDGTHNLIIPVKALPGELWLESLYLDNRKRVDRRPWAQRGALYRRS